MLAMDALGWVVLASTVAGGAGAIVGMYKVATSRRNLRLKVRPMVQTLLPTASGPESTFPFFNIEVFNKSTDAMGVHRWDWMSPEGWSIKDAPTPVPLPVGPSFPFKLDGHNSTAWAVAPVAVSNSDKESPQPPRIEARVRVEFGDGSTTTSKAVRIPTFAPTSVAPSDNAPARATISWPDFGFLTPADLQHLEGFLSPSSKQAEIRRLARERGVQWPPR